MSDFLERFSNQNYKKDDSKKPQEISDTVADTQSIIDADIVSVSSASDEPMVPGLTDKVPGSFTTDMADMVPGSVAKDKSAVMPVTEQASFLHEFSGVKSTEHDVVIDTSYNKNKTIRIITVCATAIVLCIAFFFGYQYLNRIQALDFTGKSIAEARTWSLKNQIELDEHYRFENAVDSDTIISQNIPAGSKIAKKSVISLDISKGPDPDEKIAVPVLATMSAPDIQAWIDDNKLLNTQLNQENSSTVESGKFIRSGFRDVAVDKDHFRRKDYLTIYISKGLADLTTSVTVPVITGMAKTAADSWAATNSITLNYTPQISETVLLDVIISQDKEAGVIVQSGSTIKLVVSAGAGIVIPDFSKISKEDAPAIEPALLVTVKTQYSNYIAFGDLISQSVPRGKRVMTTDNKVSAIYSEGRPYIDNLVGTSEKNIPAYFYAFTLKGANIRYSLAYVDSRIEKGMVVQVSKANEFISTSSMIYIQISKGNLH